LDTTTNAIRLRIEVASKLLAVAVGQFLLLVKPSDEVNTNDGFIARFRQALADGFGAVVGAFSRLSKPIQDQSGFSDGEAYFAEDYVDGAPLAQTYTEGLQVARRVGKVLAETPAFTDVAPVYFGKVLGHAVGATDDLNGVLPGDDQTFAFFKSLDQAADTADLLARKVDFKRAFTEDFEAAVAKAFALNKILSNALASSEVGSLRVQNYTEDMTYFAEDYVGVSQTF
jgi:hypothetical protein